MSTISSGHKVRLLVCDLDGTLSDHTPRMHLAGAGDWDAYHEGMTEDLVNPFVLWLVREMAGQVVFLTGRPDQYRARTVAWLERHDLFEGDDYMALLMRGKGEYGSDIDIKPAKLDDWIKENEGNEMLLDITQEHFLRTGEFEEEPDFKDFTLILEDRDKMVARWRDLGYDCWQVAEGAF